jgi:CTP:molybdopterin cytidylyltransferase MocA
MGRPKALIALGGTTFLGRVLQTMHDAGVRDVVVVTGAHDASIRRALAQEPGAAGVRVVTNEQHDRGQLCSLITGLDALMPLAPDAVLVALVDHPLVSSGTLVALMAAFRETRADVVRPSVAGRHGHPVIFSARVFDALRHASVEDGARAVVRDPATRVVDVPVDDPGAVTDVDTPEDLEAVRRQRADEARDGR